MNGARSRRAPASARATARSAKRPRTPGGTESDFWEFRLYVAGRTSRADVALANLTRACEEHLNGRYSIDVIDLLLNPQLARADQIIALPTLVRRLPVPIKKIVGDLSNVDRILFGLELRASAPRLRVVR